MKQNIKTTQVEEEIVFPERVMTLLSAVKKAGYLIEIKRSKDAVKIEISNTEKYCYGFDLVEENGFDCKDYAYEIVLNLPGVELDDKIGKAVLFLRKIFG